MEKKDLEKTMVCLLLFLVALIPVYIYGIRIFDGWVATQEINNPETINALRAKFDRSYNYTELFVWEHQHLNFTWGDIQRNTNPVEILDYGKGRCGEFAILYAALCRAHGYDCRLVVNIFGDHAWTQIKLDDGWIHFDPSLDINDSRVTDSEIYARDWNSAPILALAFEQSGIEDVTNHYRSGFWINIASPQMVGSIIVFFSVIMFILTINPVRKRFYALSFEHRWKKIRKIGEIYENGLRKMYILRLCLSFFLPVSIAFISPFVLDSNLILSLLVMGLGLVAFSIIELPSLTEPHIFTSVIEGCQAKNFKCEYKEGKSCKARENRLEISIKEKRIIFFRLQNLSLHTLKNCTVWFTLPENFKISEIQARKNVDFFKKYSIQKRNNAVKFSPTDNYLSVSPDDCLVFPIEAEVEKPNDNWKSHRIEIQIASETTWGTYKYPFPIKYV